MMNTGDDYISTLLIHRKIIDFAIEVNQSFIIKLLYEMVGWNVALYGHWTLFVS